jgi:chemotaxis protein methyltransferase CheR
MKRRSGLALKAAKSPLTEARLRPIVERNGLKDIGDLIDALRRGIEPLIRETVAAMTTNESWFFRDQRPFEQFRDIMLPRLLARRVKTKTLRIWCAGAALGQEPYSLAMILEERKARLAGWNIEVLATDINEDVLERAREGLYHPFEAQRGLSPVLLSRYFRRDGENWRLNQAIRSSVEFRFGNLLNSFAELGTFDVIFCRNVLIYFDQATKADVLARLQAALAPDGYLVLGVAETVLGLGSEFAPLQGARGLYVKVAAESTSRLEALAG